MNWKNRLTNYNFWISIFSAVLLILQALKIEFDIAYVNEIFTAVLGLLVVIGIISDPTRTSVKTSAEPTNKEQKKEQTEEMKPLPFVEEGETDKLNSQNDFQTILNKISTDLELKLQEIKELNKETVSYIEMQKQTQISNLEQTKQEENLQVENVELTIKPAVAEMENPYIDLLK